MPIPLPDDVKNLIAGPNFAHLATLIGGWGPLETLRKAQATLEQSRVISR